MNSLTMTAVGDVSLGDSPYCFGFGVRSSLTSRDYRDVARGLRHLLRPGDLNFANLECVMSDEGSRIWSLGRREIRGAPEDVRLLASAGWNVVSIANNHIFQHGVPAFTDTVDSLKKAGITPVGIAANPSKPVLWTSERGQAAILAFSLRPEQYRDNGNIPYALRSSDDDIPREVALAREHFHGPIICSLHWGLEFIDSATREQQQLARAIIDAGADLIVGHHPHVLQGIEGYKKGLIAYSLGNFVFDITDPETVDTGILTINFRNGKIDSHDFRPALISSDYFPRQATQAEETAIREKMHKMSARLSSDAPPLESKLIPRQRKRYQEFRKYCYGFFLRNWSRYNPYFFAYSIIRALLRRLGLVHNP